jgi:hypothetical protein
MSPAPRSFVVHPADNVATLLDNAPPGPLEILGQSSVAQISLQDAIALGHKVALRAISNGEAIIKFGISIGLATANIPAGSWIHLHNCRSRFDERSSTLDNESGAPTDTAYT